MLLFEFFPAFVMLVSLVVGIRLYLADRRARARDEAVVKLEPPDE